jgi:SAM-dependent methyltransferase
MVGDPALIYTRAYYAEAYQATLTAARLALPAVFEVLGWPQYLVDVGCGGGAWCDAAVALGVPDVTGIDGSWARPEYPKPWAFVAMDLRKPDVVAGGPRFDLALCLEVGEHLPADSAAGLVRLCCALAPRVAWSAAPPGQESVGHVNMQPQEWWGDRFTAQGYAARSLALPDDPRIPFWYRRNLVGFVAPSTRQALR